MTRQPLITTRHTTRRRKGAGWVSWTGSSASSKANRDGFARVFPGRVAPRKSETGLQREAEESREPRRQDRLVANRYNLQLSSADYAEIAAGTN